MSSISAIGGESQTASAYFKKLFKSQATGTTGSSDAASAASIFLGQNTGHKSNGLYKKIEQQVTTALQNSQKSGGGQDPNETIENAIEGVLSQSPDGGASEMAQTSAPGSSLASTDTSFLNAVQGAGVSGSQFQQDLQSAFGEAQNGQVNLASAFRTPSIGTLVDAIG